MNYGSVMDLHMEEVAKNLRECLSFQSENQERGLGAKACDGSPEPEKGSHNSVFRLAQVPGSALSSWPQNSEKEPMENERKILFFSLSV